MKYIDADEITPIMAEYVADVFSRKEHLDNISYGYCMEIAEVFQRYAERAEQEQPEVDLEKVFAHEYAIYHLPNFIMASLAVGTELIDFIYKTARHFYELGLKAKTATNE